jgi:stearoyl-CoA desaturase (delta-9 desaturase)
MTSATLKEDKANYEEENKTINEDDLAITASTNEEDAQPIKIQIVWKNVVIYIYFHIAALYGIYLCFASAKWATIPWGNVIFQDFSKQ